MQPIDRSSFHQVASLNRFVLNYKSVSTTSEVSNLRRQWQLRQTVSSNNESSTSSSLKRRSIYSVSFAEANRDLLRCYSFIKPYGGS